MRTMKDAISTVIASAKGSFHGVGSPTNRKSSPTALPTNVLIRRLRNILSPCFTTGSLDATIDETAQNRARVREKSEYDPDENRCDEDIDRESNAEEVVLAQSV